MENHPTALIDRTEWGEDAVALRFERPPGYEFAAGQYAVLSPGSSEEVRGKPLTIASAPGDDWLEFTTRLSDSEFKRALDAMRPGDGARVSAPTGRLVLPQDTSRFVFLVGGVGITPARSMLRDAAARGRHTDTVLFYGNRSDACIPYRAELEAMGTHGVTFVQVLERPPHGWSGESGFISAELVRRHTTPSPGARWIVAGPPVMVEAMERVLDDLGIPAEERMVERFSGY